MSSTSMALRTHVMSWRCVHVKSLPTFAEMPTDDKCIWTRIDSASTRYWMYFRWYLPRTTSR